MTAPVTPAKPATVTVPVETPVTTPAWLIKATAVLVVIAGPAFAWIDPSGKIDTATAQAVVTLGSLIVGAIIFSIQFVLAAVHKNGFTKLALTNIASAEDAEFKALWPQFQTLWATASPVLSQLPDMTKVTADVAELKSTVAAIPEAQKQAALDAMRQLLAVGANTVTAPNATIATPAAEAAPPVA